jgi:hypothetical protein
VIGCLPLAGLLAILLLWRNPSVSVSSTTLEATPAPAEQS